MVIVFLKTYVNFEGNIESAIRHEIDEILASQVSAADSPRHQEDLPHCRGEGQQQQRSSQTKKLSLQHPPNLQSRKSFRRLDKKIISLIGRRNAGIDPTHLP